MLDTSSTPVLARDAITWASQHGLLYGLNDPPAASIHAPVALLPTPFPGDAFARVCELMPAFSALVDAVSRDEDYLRTTLASAAQHDDFTAQLLKVFNATAESRAARADSQLVLGVHRSDYMLDADTGGFLQVELNTIASSFGCLSTLVGRMHAHLIRRSGATGLDPSALPANDVMRSIATALATAHAAYVEAEGLQDATCLMVVQPGEANVYDQEWIATTLWEEHGVRMVRRTLAEIAAQATLADGRLHIADTTVSVAYFRAGYTPDDYPSQTEWDARALLESASTVQCPSLPYQLVGAKKVQQDLAAPGVVERFVRDREAAASLRTLFAGLWGLDDLEDDATQEVVRQAVESPERYVLKPQREGGGNNLYGADLRAKLQAGEGLSAYILMQRIVPPMNRGTLVRGGVWSEEDTLSELGVYGTFLRRGDDVLLNEQAGHLVRTKAATSDEGGVAAGFSVLDSPYLVP